MYSIDAVVIFIMGPLLLYSAICSTSTLMAESTLAHNMLLPDILNSLQFPPSKVSRFILPAGRGCQNPHPWLVSDQRPELTEWGKKSWKLRLTFFFFYHCLCLFVYSLRRRGGGGGSGGGKAEWVEVWKEKEMEAVWEGCLKRVNPAQVNAAVDCHGLYVYFLLWAKLLCTGVPKTQQGPAKSCSKVGRLGQASQERGRWAGWAELSFPPARSLVGRVEQHGAAEINTKERGEQRLPNTACRPQSPGTNHHHHHYSQILSPALPISLSWSSCTGKGQGPNLATALITVFLPEHAHVYVGE